jgi:hypothetical protein
VSAQQVDSGNVELLTTTMGKPKVAIKTRSHGTLITIIRTLLEVYLINLP